MNPFFVLTEFVTLKTQEFGRKNVPMRENKYLHIVLVLCVLCEISKTRNIRPFVVENETVTGESYRNLLTHIVFPHLASLQED